MLVDHRLMLETDLRYECRLLRLDTQETRWEISVLESGSMKVLDYATKLATAYVKDFSKRAMVSSQGPTAYPSFSPCADRSTQPNPVARNVNAVFASCK